MDYSLLLGVHTVTRADDSVPTLDAKPPMIFTPHRLSRAGSITVPADERKYRSDSVVSDIELVSRTSSSAQVPASGAAGRSSPEDGTFR